MRWRRSAAPRPLPRLIEMLQAGEAKSLPTVVRALGKVGDQKIIEHLLPLLQRPENEIKVEAIAALAKLADERRAETIRMRAAGACSNRRRHHQPGRRARDDGARQPLLEHRRSRPTSARAQTAASPRKTLLIDNRNSPPVDRRTARARRQAAKLDIATLKPGDIIEGRYKFIEKIGKGAFGTVLLMEDTVVEERLILKFLNPNVSSDEEMMKRFVHELRYSRKITHKNVIRIYDFLYIRGQLRHIDGVFPLAHAGRRDRQREAGRAQARGEVRHRHRHRHGGRAPGGHRASRPEARERADQQRGSAEDRGLRRRGGPEPGRHPADQDRLRHRLAQIHGARTDPRQEGRRARRHLQPGRDPVRDVHAASRPIRAAITCPSCTSTSRARRGRPWRSTRHSRGTERPGHEVHVAGQDQARPDAWTSCALSLEKFL